MENKPTSLKIIDDIKEQIKLGVYGNNASLPSENELSLKYDVSRVTVQKALSVLVDANYIYSVPGKGYFAKELSFNKYKFKYEEFKNFNVKLLGVDIIMPPPDVIYNLQVPPKKRIVRIKRMAIKNEKPVAYDIKYIPYYSGIPIIEAEINYSLFSDLVSNLASPYEIKREIEVAGVFADDQISEVLEIIPGTPVVEVEQKLSNEDGICIGWGKVYYNIAYYKLHAEKV